MAKYLQQSGIDEATGQPVDVKQAVAQLPDGREGGLVAVGNDVAVGTGQSGKVLTSVVIGTVNTKASLPDGAGLGPSTFVIDLSKYSSSNIRLVVLTAATNHGATVQFSNDGSASNVHPATADTLLSAANGNDSAPISKKDNFAHITLTQSGTAQPVYAYVVGREMA